MTHLHATTSTGAPPDDPGARARNIDSDMPCGPPCQAEEHPTGRRPSLPPAIFPRFDGMNPCLWRAQCLEYFIRFNIQKCMWVVAATMHMEGKAKVWYEAYKLRQVVGDWSEFMDDVVEHFGVGEAVGEFSPSSPSLIAVPVCQDAVGVGLPPKAPFVDEDQSVLAPKLDVAENMENDPEELAECVVSHIDGSSLFLEQIMDTHQELEGDVHNSICLDHGIEEGKLQQLLSKEMQQQGTNSATLVLQWDPGIPLGCWWVLFQYVDEYFQSILGPKVCVNPSKDAHLLDEMFQEVAIADPIFWLPYVTKGVKLSLPWDPGKHDGIYVGPKGCIQLISLGALLLANSLRQAGRGLANCFQIINRKVTIGRIKHLFLRICHLIDITRPWDPGTSWLSVSPFKKIMCLICLFGELKYMAHALYLEKILHVLPYGWSEYCVGVAQRIPSNQGTKGCQINLLLLNIGKQDLGPTSSFSVQAAPSVFVIAKWEQWHSVHCRCIKKFENLFLQPMGIF